MSAPVSQIFRESRFGKEGIKSILNEVRGLVQSSVPRKLAMVNFSFVFVLILLSLLTFACLGWMTSLRDYVKLQALEAKQQEQVVYQLARYLAIQDPQYLKSYLDSILGVERLVAAHQPLLRENAEYSEFILYLMDKGIDKRSAIRVSQLARLYVKNETLHFGLESWIESNQFLVEQAALVQQQIRRQADSRQIEINPELLFDVSERTRQMRLAEKRFRDQLVVISDQFKWALMVILGFSASLLLILGFVTTRRLGHAVSSSLAVLEEGATLAANGDFAHTIESSEKAEIQEIASLFNEVTHQLVQSRADFEAQKALLTETRESIAVSMQQKAEFLTAMSHQIRTPMGSVLGMIELFKDTELNEEQKKYIDIAFSASDSLMNTLSEILDYSQLDAGKFQLASSSFSLAQAIESAVTQSLSKYHWDNNKVSVYIPSNVPTTVTGDVQRIGEIIEHYLVAIRDLALRADVLIICAVVRQSFSHARIKLEFRVLDESWKEDRFIELFTAESGTENLDVHGSHGLGLALSKRLICQMDGNFSADTLGSQGARSWFTIMLKKPKLQEAGLGEALRGVKALYVGKEGIEHWTVRHYLLDWGILLEEEGTSTAALNKLNEAMAKGNPYQLLILGSHIQGEDRFSLSRTVKISPRLSKISTIVLGDMDADQIRESGVSAAVSWPLKRKEFYETLLEAAHLKQVKRSSDNDEIGQYRFQGKVLLAEDNQVNSQVAVGLLSKLGLAVEVVSNGELALAAVKSNRYDLVLMDCQMPKLDGYSASEQIRTWEEKTDQSRTLIIAMTAESGEDAKQRCLDAGMDDYLMKPVKRQVLAEVLSNWMPYELTAESDAKTSEQVGGSYVALDAKILDELRGLMEDGFEDLLTSYLEDTLVLMDELDASMVIGDQDSVVKKAHILKSSSANIGALNL
ncbi:MAG TPA: hypothetical protein DCZ03_01535, partial [Gammaproteobacteria bacterium]|nr:hypothetical protein [Gammaproteobacteria bacterium]